MDHFAGLDVSVKETSVCIVDDTGRIVREVKVASEPEALLTALKNPSYHFKRIGLEAGPLSQWLFSALTEAELPVVCVETRHMQAVLKAQINKTDRNDARGIAQMMRGALPPGACEDATQPETADDADPSQIASVEGHRHRERSTGTLRNFGLRSASPGRRSSRPASKTWSRTFPTWPSWSNQCSLSGGRCANRSSSCIAVYWPSSGMMRCAGA